MRFYAFRFTIRWLMIAVAIVGITCAWGIMRLRYERLASYHNALSLGLHFQSPAESRRTDHHAALRAKYKRAARYPWLPVSPDPPEPK